MTRYVLDTDTCIYWLNGETSIRDNISRRAPLSLNTTMITYAELKFGAYNSKRTEENLRNIENFIKGVPVLPLNREASDAFGSIKAQLRREGQPIGDFDILIAAITLSFDAILVTNNLSHFERVEELRCESWRE